jgi:hypothetical protein
MMRAQPQGDSNSECADSIGAEADVATQQLKTKCQRLGKSRISLALGIATRLIDAGCDGARPCLLLAGRDGS